MIRVSDNTFADRANFLTGGRVVVTDTFGAEFGIDDIDLIAD